MTKLYPARRGDLVCVTAIRRYASLLAGMGCYQTIHVGQVTSINVAGHIKAIKVGERRMTPRDWDESFIIPKTKVDVDAARHLIGQAFTTLEDVRKAFLPYRLAA